LEFNEQAHSVFRLIFILNYDDASFYLMVVNAPLSVIEHSKENRAKYLEFLLVILG
jgi:hypothetical protein